MGGACARCQVAACGKQCCFRALKTATALIFDIDKLTASSPDSPTMASAGICFLVACVLISTIYPAAARPGAISGDTERVHAFMEQHKLGSQRDLLSFIERVVGDEMGDGHQQLPNTRVLLQTAAAPAARTVQPSPSPGKAATSPAVAAPPTVATPPTAATPPTVATPPTAATPPKAATPPTFATPPSAATPPSTAVQPPIVLPILRAPTTTAQPPSQSLPPFALPPTAGGLPPKAAPFPPAAAPALVQPPASIPNNNDVANANAVAVASITGTLNNPQAAASAVATAVCV